MCSGFKRVAIIMLWAVLVAAGFAAFAEDVNEPLQATLRKQVGDGCQIRETEHWLIVHHADPKWVDAAAKMLERTHDLFFQQFKKAGFEPQPPGQKLVCVLLGKQEDFVQYLERARDSVGQPAAAEQPAAEPGKAKPRAGLGSYSERTNRIQMCDIRGILPQPSRTRDAARLEWENVARIAHEAAHQQLVTMSPSEARQPENKGPTYVQGWGLFRFLFTERPQQLKKYLAALAARPRGPVRRSEVLATFEAAFGPVDELDRDWQQFLKRLCSDESKD